jgi:hypothetical protein
MPETAVYKNYDFVFWENKIWGSCNPKMSAPTAYFVLAQEPSKCKFCDFIAATPYRTHYCGSLLV